MTERAKGIRPVGPGKYVVEHDGRNEVIYVAGGPSEEWVFWNGRVFRLEPDVAVSTGDHAVRPRVAQTLTAPMPARVVTVLVEPGATIKKGDTAVLLEAMKMELPVRAPADGTVVGVHCREGDLVQGEAVLVELK